MKQIIMNVLDDMSESQVNLASSAARETVSSLISAALKTKGSYIEFTDYELDEQKARAAWVCSICGENTFEVDYDYIGSGYNHLGCELKSQEDIDEYIEDIEESFQPLPIFKVEHQGKEVFGLELLDKIREAIYGDKNPEDIYHNESPFQVKEYSDYYKISMYLPFIGEAEFGLEKFGDELIITVNGRKKSVLLPRFANFLKLSGHGFEDSWLHIRLKKG